MYNTNRMVYVLISLTSLLLLRHLWQRALHKSCPLLASYPAVHHGPTTPSSSSGHNATADQPLVQHTSPILSTNINNKQPHCANLHNASTIHLSLKTGSTEALSKVPAHILTTLTCPSSFLVFSDLVQTIGSHTTIDALSSLHPSILSNNSHDMSFYHLLQTTSAENGDLEALSNGRGAWGLDKYEFLPMIAHSLEVAGKGIQWFVFVEADTYLHWPNLVLWLGHLDASDAVCAGAQVVIGNTEFAHGGSGWVMSRVAVERVVRLYKNNQAEWDQRISEGCCGDEILAQALMETRTRLLRAFPLMQGETVWSLDWSRVHWCKPAVTWHHVTAREVDALWQMERRWVERMGGGMPMLFRDVWEDMVKRYLVEEKKDWDNLSKEWVVDGETLSNFAERSERNSTESKEMCRTLCESKENCLQWAWRLGRCSGSDVMRLGKAATEMGDGHEGTVQTVYSGWMLRRIKLATAAMGPCDESQQWITRNENG